VREESKARYTTRPDAAEGGGGGAAGAERRGEERRRERRRGEEEGNMVDRERGGGGGELAAGLMKSQLPRGMTVERETDTLTTGACRAGVPNPRAAARYRSAAWLEPGRGKKVNK